MSSKKKRRLEEYLKRQAKRDAEKKRVEDYKKALNEGNLEEMAKAMGIKLK